MTTIKLSQEQTEYLVDIVDTWLDGMEATANATCDDRFLSTPEDLLQAAAGVDKLYLDAKQIRIQLVQSIGEAVRERSAGTI